MPNNIINWKCGAFGFDLRDKFKQYKYILLLEKAALCAKFFLLFFQAAQPKPTKPTHSNLTELVNVICQCQRQSHLI